MSQIEKKTTLEPQFALSQRKRDIRNDIINIYLMSYRILKCDNKTQHEITSLSDRYVE